MSKYIVCNKSDDYGNCRLELVETSAKNAGEYSSHKKVAPKDVPILEKYLPLVPLYEEAERSDVERFYGYE